MSRRRGMSRKPEQYEVSNGVFAIARQNATKPQLNIELLRFPDLEVSKCIRLSAPPVKLATLSRKYPPTSRHPYLPLSGDFGQ